MNRKNLTTAVLAGLAGAAGIAATATAQTAPTMSLNPDGIGQVLIYPYYTTRNGNNTVLSVVNTTGAAVDISGWYLEDEDGATTRFPEGTVLAPQEAAVVFGADREEQDRARGPLPRRRQRARRLQHDRDARRVNSRNPGRLPGRRRHP